MFIDWEGHCIFSLWYLRLITQGVLFVFFEFFEGEEEKG